MSLLQPTGTAIAFCNKASEVGELRTQRSKKEKATASDRRCCNLMIFHALETTDTNPQARNGPDVKFLQSLIDRLLEVGEQGLRMKQIAGRGKRDSGKSRPQRVSFADDASPRLVLSRLGRTKGLMMNIHPDMDPSDGNKLQSAIIELKRRTDSVESSLRIINFRVVPQVR